MKKPKKSRAHKDKWTIPGFKNAQDPKLKDGIIQHLLSESTVDINAKPIKI